MERLTQQSIAHAGSGRRRFLCAGLAGLLAPGAFAQGRRSFTDAAGRSVELPAKVARVYAAGPPASILLFALAPEKILGWTTPFRPEERPYIPARYADLPTLGRLTGRGGSANVETLLAARPDLVIDYGAVRPTYASLAERVQAQTGIPFLLIDGSFALMPRAFRELGAMLGETARGEDWARYAERTLAEVDARIAKIPADRRVRVYYGRGPAGLDTGLAGSINVESLERAGALNVAAALGKGGMVRVSVEQVLAWDPDVIVTIDRAFYEAVWNDPLWKPLRAVRTGRVHLSPNVPYGWIDFPPSINRLIGLRWLAKVLYPQAFPEDLRPAVAEFYTRAFHQAPSAAQLDALLRAPARRGAP